MKIWVDDIRTPPDWDEEWQCTDWLWADNSNTAILMLAEAKEIKATVGIMSLDHDLGGDDTTRPIVLWMCENDFWPVELRVHSANPTGIEWLESMIARYHPTNIAKHQMIPPNLNRQYTCVECGDAWPCRIGELNEDN